jgi:orotate phosphoribosyltransferase
VLAQQTAHRAEAVCAPLVEGAFVGLMVATSLDLPFAYAEPRRDDRATGLFPVSYPIPKVLAARLRGRRVAIVDDVINAGSAVRGTLASLGQCGAQAVAIGALGVYGDAASELAAGHGVALETLASFASQIWEPAPVPCAPTGCRCMHRRIANDAMTIEIASRIPRTRERTRRQRSRKGR